MHGQYSVVGLEANYRILAQWLDELIYGDSMHDRYSVGYKAQWLEELM
jgi:hypothetical protein